MEKENIQGVTYVLKLAGNNWYVGFTQDLPNRLFNHGIGNGASWTRIHKPIALQAIFFGSQEIEQKIFQEMLRLYPAESIRGAGYCVPKTPPKVPKKSLPPEYIFSWFSLSSALYFFI